METSINLINNLIKRNKLTITQFSTKVGINKGTLSSIVKGSRKISESSFFKIINSGLMSDEEKSEFTDCYFAEEYGVNALKKAKHFLAALSEHEGFENSEYVALIPNLDDFNINSEYEFLSGKKDILKAITTIMTVSLENGQSIYTNYSSTDKELDNIVYSILLNSENKNKFYHVVAFTDNKKSYDNIDISFSLLKFMQIKVNAYYKIQKGDSNENDELYTNYFTTKDIIVFYDKDFSSGVFVRKKDFVQSVYTKTVNNFRKYSLLCRFPENVLSQMEDLGGVTNSEIAIRFNPHIFPVLTKDDWNACISDKIENKASLVDLAYDWYASARGVNTINYSTMCGWLDFLKTGHAFTQPDFLVADLDIELRRKITISVIDNLKAGIMTHKMLQDEIRLPKNLIVEQIGDYIYFVTTAKENSMTDWLGSAFLFLPAKLYNNFFTDTIKYLELGGYFYSSEETVTIFENMLAHCRNEATINNVLK